MNEKLREVIMRMHTKNETTDKNHLNNSFIVSERLSMNSSSKKIKLLPRQD